MNVISVKAKGQNSGLTEVVGQAPIGFSSARLSATVSGASICILLMLTYFRLKFSVVAHTKP